VTTSDPIFVFRIGPVELGGELTHWYLTKPPIDDVFYGDDPAEVLGRIAAAASGHPLEVEPALAEAGQPLGVTVRPLTDLELRARAKLWLNAEVGAWNAAIKDGVAHAIFLDSAAGMARLRSPFAGVIELELALRGYAGAHAFDETLAVLWTDPRGLMLFASVAAMNQFQTATLAGDLKAADAFPRWALQWVHGSPGLAGALMASYGVAEAPVATHLEAGERRPLDGRATWRMALVIGALECWALEPAAHLATQFTITDVDARTDVSFLRALVSQGDRLEALDWEGFAARRS